MSASDNSRCARADFSACEIPREEDGALLLFHSYSADFFEASDGVGPTVELWFQPENDGLSCVDVNIGHIRLTLEEWVAPTRCDIRFKVQRIATGGCPEVIYKLSRTEWLPDTPAEAMVHDESATGDFEGAAALVKDVAALFGAHPAQLVDAISMLPQHNAALEKLLALCGDLCKDIS